MFIDYIILALYALSMVAIAIYTRKRSGSVNDFLLAGKRGLNGWMSAFAYGTTYFSAVIFIGYAGKFGQAYGLASVWIGIANAIFGSLFAWMALASRTKNMTARLSAKTMPEFFEKRFGGSRLKIVTAIVIFVFLIPYSASVYNGLGNLFGIVFGIPGWVIMIALAALTALYLFFGGYFATALSDFIQGIIMIIGVVLMVIFFMNSDNVSWNLSETIENPKLNFLIFDGENTGLFGDGVSLLSLILLTSFGVWALPQTIHKYYAIRDKKAIRQGTIVSTLFALIIGFGAYFVGSLSYYFREELIGVSVDNVIPAMLLEVIPVGLMGVIAVLILSASMSTLSSVSLASASVVAVDLYKGAVNKKADDKRVNTVMKSLCLVFVVISVLLAILNEQFGVTAIAYMMGISWGTLAGCFMGPFVLGLFWKKVSRASVWASIITSLTLTAALTVIFGYMQVGEGASLGEAVARGFGSSPLIGVICMVASLIVTSLVTLFTKRPSDEIIYNAFNKPIENEIK